MKRITIGLLAAALAASACGAEPGGIDLPTKDGAPLIQVRSEGGFAPVEYILGRGPRYTLLNDGRLIYEGPVIDIFPGPLVPNHQVLKVSDDDLRSVLDLVQRMGLPDMVDESDDSATRTVADATTEIVTYWDADGAHRYSVYALGIFDDQSSKPATATFQELVELLDQLTASGPSDSYSGAQVQYVIGSGFAAGADLRDWPLANTDFTGWRTLPNGWLCQVQSGPIPSVFAGATSETVWSSPEADESLKILVRALLPGEEPCFTG